MTLAASRPRARALSREDLLLVAAIAACVSLTTRGLAWRSIALTLLVGVAAWIAPSKNRDRASFWTCLAVAVVGVGAFVAVRLRTPVLPFVGTAAGGAASLVAAVAEEVVFRRLVYDALSRWGGAVAIVGSALAFAAIHVPLYGFIVLPIDVAAGALLGWQRWATGTVTVPALTHVAANLLSIL